MHQSMANLVLCLAVFKVSTYLLPRFHHLIGKTHLKLTTEKCQFWKQFFSAFFTNNRNCNKLGQQAWVAIAMVVTEVLIVLKFDLPLVLMVPPMSVIVCWTIFCLILLTWTIWFFFVRPYRKFKRKQMMQAQRPFSRTSKNTFYRQIKTTNQERVTKQETNPKRSVQPRTTTNGGYSTRLRSRLSNGD